MNTPVTHNFKTHYKGDYWNGATFTIERDGLPIDLTGVSVLMQFRKDRKTGDLEREISTLNEGIVLPEPEQGVIIVSPFIMNFEAGVYYYDIQVTYVGGAIKTYVNGRILVKQDISYN